MTGRPAHRVECTAPPARPSREDRRSHVGLLDRFKETADGVVQGAKDKVSDATGVDVDQVIEGATSAVDAADGLVDAVDSAKQAKDKLFG
jgi:hypothetical protein